MSWFTSIIENKITPQAIDICVSKNLLSQYILMSIQLLFQFYLKFQNERFDALLKEFSPSVQESEGPF